MKIWAVLQIVTDNLSVCLYTRATIDFCENRLKGNLFTCLPVLLYL